MRPHFRKDQCVMILFSLAYGTLMLLLNDRPLSELHGISPFHRYQATALLQGRLSLTDSIDAIQPGLAWHDGKVQQVWGLGIGIWLAPFQVVWNVFGGGAFPDRAALGVAFALLAFYATRTGVRIVREDYHAFGLALIWIILLCPALWTLAHVQQLIFEETILYAILVSLALLVSLVRIALFRSCADYLLCCALAGFSAWVRPTHGIYGLAAVLVSSTILWRWRGAKEVIMGSAIWLTSLALLGWTNQVRFGSPTEFGHRLTASTGSMVYLTRFGNPFQEANPFEAGKELGGLLFLNPNVRGAGAFSENLFLGQSSAIRWRRLELTTFNITYALVCLAAIIGTMVWLAKGRKLKPNGSAQQLPGALVVPFFLWSSMAIAALAIFYLYYPAIASRYLFDFAPAFAGFVLLTLTFVCDRWPRTSLAAVIVWLVYGIATARVPVSERPVAPKHHDLALSRAKGIPLRDFKGSYSPSHHPISTGIACNGSGWEPGSGFASSVVTLVIDRPEFVELRVTPRRAMYGEPARKDVYRAMIAGKLLPLREIPDDNEELKITFDVPFEITASRQDHLLFLCFSDGYDADDRSSERFLYSVRWR